MFDERDRKTLRDALDRLGVRHFVLGIQDPSFPGRDDEDLGRGSPCSQGAAGLLEFARGLGFDGIQLGPQGLPSEDNPSPYDSTLFSRNVLNVALRELTTEKWAHLLPEQRVDTLVRRRPPGSDLRAAHAHVYPAQRRALWEAFERLEEKCAQGNAAAKALDARVGEFLQAQASWLEPDALYEALCREHQRPYWREWPNELDRRAYAPPLGQEVAVKARRDELLATHADAIRRYAFEQLVVHAQHQELRARAKSLGLALFGDVQIGRAPQDAWSQQALFLPGYLVGAPPSRTNPEGQDWGYPVLDPRQYARSAGPVLEHVRGRMSKLLAEYDGLRVDHPHGLVCPWVYRDVRGEGLAAVRQGARLFESPDLPDHPELAPFAIARAEQLDRSKSRFADGWVQELTAEQVERYSVLFDALAERVRDVACEVLSTMPYPLQRVLERHGLGRFRVTQKVDLEDPADVYRSEHARLPDWIMLGNHDTPTIWQVVEAWRAKGRVFAHAAYLSERLCPPSEDSDQLAHALAADDGLLAQAKFAELFWSKAQNVVVFFTDLFGMTERYNTPGVVDPSNWTLRLPRSYARDYAARLGSRKVLDVPLALSMALKARRASPELVAALEALSHKGAQL